MLRAYCAFCFENVFDYSWNVVALNGFNVVLDELHYFVFEKSNFDFFISSIPF